MTRGVRVNAPIYTEIGRVTATDADAEAAEIKYKLENVTFVRPSTGYRKVLGPSAFLVDPLTGVIQTNQSYGRYSDGYFDVVIKAHNTPEPSRMDLAFMKIFVLQDTDLMKFVFDKNPVNVAKQMKEFKYEIEAALAEPLTLNVYDNEFYSKVDGSLDFGRTSSCFQAPLWALPLPSWARQPTHPSMEAVGGSMSGRRLQCPLILPLTGVYQDNIL